MSFSGRLNGGSNGGHGHQAVPTGSGSGSGNVVPLSICSHNLDGFDDKLSLPFVMTRAAAVISDEQKQALVYDLIECKAKLLDQSKAMKQLKEAHEVQLVAVSRQLLELECGLRKRERELCAILQQRDRVIREQSHIIRFLTKKTGKTKTKAIRSLADEAAAKIPQWSSTSSSSDKAMDKATKLVKSVSEEMKPIEDIVAHKDQMKPNGRITSATASTEVTLTSIMESESENDSAVILDDLASPTSKSSSSGCVSRSVSDVMSSETELEKVKDSSPFESPNYRGFLLRHGSYERYKIRSRMQQLHQQQHPHDFPTSAASTGVQKYSNQVTANATLPRNRKKVHKSEQRELDRRQNFGNFSKSATDLSSPMTKNASTTVIVINDSSNVISGLSGGLSSSSLVGGGGGSSNETTTGPCKSNNSHRTVTKPRDVKNKSNNRTKMVLKTTTTTMTASTTTSVASPPNSKSPSPPMFVTSDKFIQQSGSVYCSLYGIDMSEDEVSYA